MDYKTILIVDDEPDILGELSIFFSRSGFRVLLAENGTDALEEFQEYEPAVVITDYRMPGMNGIELLEELKARNHMTQVIFMSGHADMRVAVQALKEHAFDFLPKPLDLEQLLEVTKAAIERARIKQMDREFWTGLALSHERFDIPKPLSVVHFKTNLDEFQKPRILLEFNKFIEEGKLLNNLIFSMGAVNYINNVGLNLLVALNGQMKDAGKKVMLAAVNSNVMAYMKTLGYHDFFEIGSSLESAMTVI